MNKYLLPLAGLALVAVAGGANAASVNQNFTVTATVNAACTLGTASNVVFGPFAGPITAGAATTNGSVAVTCTNGAAYQASLAPITAVVTTPTTSVTIPLANGASSVNSTVSLGAPTGGGTGTGAAQTYNLNGNLATGLANPTVGTYTGTGTFYVYY